jgi:hypothetical protein
MHSKENNTKSRRKDDISFIRECLGTAHDNLVVRFFDRFQLWKFSAVLLYVNPANTVDL